MSASEGGCSQPQSPEAVISSQPCRLATQMVVTGCWLTVKEASLLLGSLASEAPIAKAGSGTAPLLAPAQLAEVGRQLMRFMGVIKHSGAVEKAQTGFIALCDRHAPRIHCKHALAGPLPASESAAHALACCMLCSAR